MTSNFFKKIFLKKQKIKLFDIIVMILMSIYFSKGSIKNFFVIFIINIPLMYFFNKLCNKMVDKFQNDTNTKI